MKLLDIEAIRAAIYAQQADWTAEETPIFLAGVKRGDPSSLLFGLQINDDTGRLRAANADVFGSLIAAPAPTSADWRAAGGVTAARDQGRCRVCVAFATCAAMETSRWIATGALVELSPGHLFHCNGGSCDDGWGLAHGLEAGRQGVGLEAALPWDPRGVCRTIPAVARVTGFKAHWTMADRKRAVAQAPVVGGLKVHEDLLAYGSGVYRHVAGDFLDYHAVCVIGFDDAAGAWLVKNSWGERFGDRGFFRIAYGECELDDVNAFYSVETSA